MEESEQLYAGFWRRFLAYIIDSLIIGAVQMILILPFFLIFGLSIFGLEEGFGDEYSISSALSSQFNNEMEVVAVSLVIAFIVVIAIVSVIIQWLYFALMESSAKQATLGKMAIGAYVTDLEGNRITFGRATGRYFGKIVSGLILNIGYIMAGFTQKKQALHDLMANCLVLRKY
jgi:uncharacterized RDD family membrane protein YckC